ncbi:hypothetical protein PLICRDRAFT_41518 [Plicaturopsis crispa FD-325 SS-3]|nr:hypothetical protein PLICRDRAFT_41518 [Plicaturopsis crispa FD-325 SS-3]
MADLANIAPPKELSEADRLTVFEHFSRHLAVHRNTAELYAAVECSVSSLSDEKKTRTRDAFSREMNKWAQALFRNAWIACQEPGGGECPELDPYAETSTARLPPLPSHADVSKILNTVLFLHVTTAKHYSARTRSFLSAFGTVDEGVIVSTLKHPEEAIKATEKHADKAKEEHADRGKTLRMVGLGLGAVAGGVLVGVTGGLAAPLVGAGVTTVLGWVGVGGTAAGLLASGLAGSSVVCGALFGAYGAKSTANMVARHTREIRDLAVVPVTKPVDTLAVRLCVSGWLASPEDVTAPWTVFGGDDTVALQWEIEALEALSNAFGTLLKTQAMQLVKAQIIKRTVFAALLSSLSPIAWLKIGQIIDNPWMNARALAVKAGAVLGTLLSQRAFGNRPVTLVGYSLGSLVILEALKFLASLPPSSTLHLVQDVFVLGAPASADAATWSAIRRVVAGRLVNGYSTNDYVLAVLSRASTVSWGVAGLQAVEVQGVENVECADVDGHLMWRGMIGTCLERCGAPGILRAEVQKQVEKVAKPMEADLKASKEDVKDGSG